MLNKFKIIGFIICFNVFVTTNAQTYITIETPLEGDCYFIFSNDFLFYDSLKLESNTKIKIECKNILIGELNYQQNKFPLFLEEYDDLKIQINDNKINFSKVGAANNTFLQQYNTQIKKEISYYEKSVDIIEINAFELWELEKKIIREYPKHDFLTLKFIEYLKTESQYKYHKAMLKYGILHKNAERISKDMIYKFDFNEISVKDKLISSSFRSFLFYYSAYKTLEDNNFEYLSSVTGMYVLHAYWLNQNVKPIPGYRLDYEVLLHYASELDKTIIKYAFNFFEKDNNSTYKRFEKILQPYLNQKDVVENEEKIPTTDDLIAHNLKGKEVKLSDFKNKIIYVDVWATWCGPCRKEFPYSVSLKNELSKKAQKSIIFLYISIDEDESKWKSTLDKLGLEGEQWISKGGWNSNVVKYFGISSIPRYIIIGKDGQILDPNAPRPSNTQTKFTLEKLAL